MSARVNIEADAWDDWRFSTLARLCGLGRPGDGRSELIEAGLIRCARIWAWQTKHYTPQRPTYVVSADLVETYLGSGGADAMVRAELAERVPDGYRICGSHGRIEWQHKLIERAKVAGQGSARKRKRDDTCQPVAQPPVEQPVQPDVEPQANLLSSSLSSLDTDQNHTLTPRARAIPTAVTVYSPQQVGAAWRLAEETYRRLSDARVSVAAELGVANALPFPAITPATRPQGYRDLLDRVREEGPAAPAVCDRVVESLVLQARDTKSVEWLSEKAFTAGGWRTAREYVAGAKARASPRHDHRIGRAEPCTADEFTEGDQPL